MWGSLTGSQRAVALLLLAVVLTRAVAAHTSQAEARTQHAKSGSGDDMELTSTWYRDLIEQRGRRLAEDQDASGRAGNIFEPESFAAQVFTGELVLNADLRDNQHGRKLLQLSSLLGSSTPTPPTKGPSPPPPGPVNGLSGNPPPNSILGLVETGTLPGGSGPPPPGPQNSGAQLYQTPGRRRLLNTVLPTLLGFWNALDRIGAIAAPV